AAISADVLGSRLLAPPATLGQRWASNTVRSNYQRRKRLPSSASRLAHLLFAICNLLFGDEPEASHRASLTTRSLLVDHNGRQQNRSPHQVLIKGVDIQQVHHIFGGTQDAHTDDHAGYRGAAAL